MSKPTKRSPASQAQRAMWKNPKKVRHQVNNCGGKRYEHPRRPHPPICSQCTDLPRMRPRNGDPCKCGRFHRLDAPIKAVGSIGSSMGQTLDSIPRVA